MCKLDRLSLAQLTAMTKVQIIGAILGGETNVEVVGNESSALGPLFRHEVERDRLTGNRVRGRVTRWYYYPSGAVKDIVVSERDAGDIETRRRTITHYEDGRQPTVVEA